MAAMPKGTLGSCADKWIIIGRTQEYSAHHVCNPPPMGAAGPIVGPWSIICTSDSPVELSQTTVSKLNRSFIISHSEYFCSPYISLD